MRTLTRKMMRTILRSRGQVIAVAAVVLCGIATYVTLATCHRNLLLTRDTYYAQNRFADFEIMLERAPKTALFKLEEIPGVRRVRGRILEEVKLEVPGIDDARTGRLVSMPDIDGATLNDVVIMEGRYFEPNAQNEVIVGQRFGQANNLNVGDSIEATIDGRKHTLKVVGFGLSPEFVYIIRNLGELVPNPEQFGILWVTEDFAESAMNMQEAINNIVGSVDNLNELDRILEQAEDRLDGYGVFSKVEKEDQLSNFFISQEIESLGVMAKVIPVIFLGVAALVILILLNRMVRNERTQIGLLKAYGYSNLAVAMHYVQFALIISLAGCVGGFLIGQWMANGMIWMYNEQIFNFPILRSRIYPELWGRAAGIAVVFALFGAISAAYRAARIQPAESMRPEAPVIGHRTWLERIAAVWQRLSFTWKMIARNVGRNKFRASLNALGVMISSGLLIVGYFAIDGMNYLLEFEYEKSQRQDATIGFVIERGKDAFYESSRFDYVREAEPVLQYPFEMRNGWREKDVVVTGLPADADLRRLMDTEGRRIRIADDGLVLSQNLAAILEVDVGDRLRLKPLMGKIDKEFDVRVSQVVQQYFGMAGYMEINALSRLLDEPFAVNAVLLRTDRGMENRLNDELKDVPAVTSIAIKKESLESLQNTLQESMWIMSMMSVIFAGVIAFAIIYNVTIVSLTERQRELASLRVLGFTQEEVGRILYNENVVTGAVGLLLGIPFGMLICYGMVKMYPTELFVMPYNLTPKTLIIANAFTIAFIVIANLAVRRKIHRLNLVETLKTRE